MRFNLLSAVVVAFAASQAVASTWLGTKAVYNKWHETELERWLSDHGIPYPTPADRKDLEDAVKANWNSYVVSPYQSWQTTDLTSYLTRRGQQIKQGTENNKDALIAQVQSTWTDTEESVSSAYANVRDWIFDSWTDSQLKAFCDKNGIPVPQPRTRDSILHTIRENYSAAAARLSEQISYPGDWLYASWSDSDLKAWLDERGYPAPQPSTRDKLVAQVRRNSRLASQNYQAMLSSASAEAAKATQYLSDELLNAWSDSKIKEWADSNGIPVPQGSKRNELIALARKHRSKLYASGASVASEASGYYEAATSNAGNEYARATDEAFVKGNKVYGALGYYTELVKEKLGYGSGPTASFSRLRSGASAKAADAAKAVKAGAASVKAEL